MILDAWTEITLFPPPPYLYAGGQEESTVGELPVGLYVVTEDGRTPFVTGPFPFTDRAAFTVDATNALAADPATKLLVRTWAGFVTLDPGDLGIALPKPEPKPGVDPDVLAAAIHAAADVWLEAAACHGSDDAMIAQAGAAAVLAQLMTGEGRTPIEAMQDGVTAILATDPAR